MNIRLQHGGAYNTDIANLRNAIRANGTQVQCNPLDPLVITHPLAENVQARLYINLAYQSNSALPPATASLYVVAFQNTDNIVYRFNIPELVGGVCGFPDAEVVPSNGSYQQLGRSMSFEEINDYRLGQAVRDVAGYQGNWNDNIQRALVNLIVSTSEAARFSTVEAGIASVLGNENSYNPNWNEIHDWGGHILGGA